MKHLLSIFGCALLLSACAGHISNGLSSKNNEQMGVKYLLGRGVAIDNKKAFIYFKRAAEGGNPFAQNELAYLYFSGKGTPQDFKNAFYWYHEAAEQGLSSAQYNLGIFYERGIGTEPNIALAREWYEKSASRGFGPAKKALSKL